MRLAHVSVTLLAGSTAFGTLDDPTVPALGQTTVSLSADEFTAPLALLSAFAADDVPVVTRHRSTGRIELDAAVVAIERAERLGRWNVRHGRPSGSLGVVDGDRVLPDVVREDRRPHVHDVNFDGVTLRRIRELRQFLLSKFSFSLLDAVLDLVQFLLCVSFVR
jgi:hypothetical protein